MERGVADWPEEANVIARILARYGELELSLARVVGYALSPTSGETYLTGIRKGLRLLFHRRGELARLELTNLFLAEELQAAGARCSHRLSTWPRLRTK